MHSYVSIIAPPEAAEVIVPIILGALVISAILVPLIMKRQEKVTEAEVAAEFRTERDQVERIRVEIKKLREQVDRLEHEAQNRADAA